MYFIDRNVSDGDVAVVEPAGSPFTPALKIISPVHLTVSSAPIELKYPIVPHTASLSIRGSGDWKIRTGGPGIRQRSNDFKAGDEWQRIELPFNPKYSTPFCQIFLEGEGTLYIDKVQVGPSEKYRGSYQPPMEAEIAVALAPGFDAGAAGVVFDDESAVFNIASTGNITGATVHWKLFDITGGTLKEGSLKTTPRLRLTDLTSRYGSFRLELCLEHDGRQISPCDEVLWHRLHRPHYWGRDAPDSPFAVHTLSTTRHIVMAKAIGINWTRLHDAGLEYCGWWNLEPEKGKWRFFDTEIQRYRKHGIRILAELGTAPAWASCYQDTRLKTFGYFDKFFQPKDLNDYANYVRVFCNRYKDEIDAFDIWNEPWIHAWWGVGYDHSKKGREGYLTSEHPQADFAELTKTAHAEVHKIIPGAQVFGVNTTTSGGISTSTTSMSGTQWTRGVLEAGGVEHCDGIAFHAYTTAGVGYPGDSVEGGISNAVGVIRDKYNGSLPRPLWMTEGSPLIHRMGNGIYNHVIGGEESSEVLESADRIARYHLSMLANGVTRMFIYSMHSHDGRFRDSPKQWNAFTTDDGALHPSGAAHAQLAWMLEDTRFKEIRPVGKGVYAYIFEGEGRSVAALSSAPGSEQVPLPAKKGIAITDLFGNPLPKDALFIGQVLYLEAPSTETLGEVLKF